MDMSQRPKARNGRRYRQPPPPTYSPTDTLHRPRHRPPPPRIPFENLDISISGLIKALYRYMDGITNSGKELLIVAETGLRLIYMRPVHIRPDFITLLKNVCRDYIKNKEGHDTIRMACQNVLDTLTGEQKDTTIKNKVTLKEIYMDPENNENNFRNTIRKHNTTIPLPPLN